MSKSQAVVDAAMVYVNAGYQEKPNNDTIFGKWYGLNNQPWCAMFVSKCFDEAGVVKLVAASGKKGFASCDAGLKWFAKNNQLIPVGDAQPGDVVLVFFVKMLFINFDVFYVDFVQFYHLFDRVCHLSNRFDDLFLFCALFALSAFVVVVIC